MSSALREIAELELDQCFDDLSPTTRDELANSLVRQWIGNDGKAIIVNRDFEFSFALTTRSDGALQVVRERAPQTFVDHMRKSRVIERDIPRLLHEVSIRQTTECMADYGQKLRLRAEPNKSPTFFIEYVLDDEPWHRYPNN